jgi:succinate dehydrogenase/fumarate reductase flavoprotein subunit
VNDRAASAEEARLRNLANLKGKEQVAGLRKALKLAMWQGVGVLRNKEGLTSALAKLKAIDEQLPSVSVNSIRELNQVIALSNMVTVSEMVARAARLRAESRGAHYRMDHPEEDNTNWLRNITITKAGERMTLRPVDVDLALVAG